MNTPNEIVQLAKTWALSWDFCDIDTITWDYKDGGGKWYRPDPKSKAKERRTKAAIVVGGGEGLDLIYHEAFHSTLFKSPLRKAAPEWCEGWCNAFSEVMRQKFTAYPTDRDARPKTRHHREYLMACAVICEYVDRDPAKLMRLWAAANRPGCAKVFSQWMGYNPKTGVFIDPDRYPKLSLTNKP